MNNLNKSLKASIEGLEKLKKAKENKGWSDKNLQVHVSRILEPEQEWTEKASNDKGNDKGASGCSIHTLRRCINYGKSISANVFKAICKALELDWEEIYEKEQDDCDTDVTSMYIASSIENQCCSEIEKPGGLIRITSPEKTDKTLLLGKIFSHAVNKNYKTVRLDFILPNDSLLSNYEKFIKWICSSLSKMLSLEEKIDDYWDTDIQTINDSCTNYLENFILPQIETNLTLCFDNMDKIFEQENKIFNDFCNLILAWHKKPISGNASEKIWQKLRLVIVHSTDVYGTNNIHTSPLGGAGKVIQLTEFSRNEVIDLIKKYQLNKNDLDIDAIMTMLAGHRLLVNQLLSEIKSKNSSLEEILNKAPTSQGIFNHYLRTHSENIKKNEDLKKAFLLCVNSPNPIKVDDLLIFQLQRMGLVTVIGNTITPKCQLYRLYFSEHLKPSTEPS